ncbi:MAG: restriction endonuclease [Syntrophobacteraceae bacterium]|nr:McrC family protein [Desulfobacteraceae bacterium]
MIDSGQRIYDIIEFEQASFEPEEHFDSAVQKLWETYGQSQKRIDVDLPSFKTDHRWRLTSRGWIGFIPVTPLVGFRLNSKVPISNIFRMLEYAYRLQSFHLLEGIANFGSLEDIYDRLAKILAKSVLDRARKGFYRTYLGETELLSFLRGRIDIQYALQCPLDAKLRCHYEEHTADVAENQILAWSLSKILRARLCSDETLILVRHAFHSLQGFARIHPYSPRDCIRRFYNRLNEDYKPLHALCRFFLEQTGPTHDCGDHQMIPFLVKMSGLFEMFVYEWLKCKLPLHLILTGHDRVRISEECGVQIDIDMVLYDTERQKVVCVLDTKYKAPDSPASDDMMQVVSYAVAKGCNEAVLIYPTLLPNHVDTFWGAGRIRVRSLVFDIGKDLEEAGNGLLRGLSDIISQ